MFSMFGLTKMSIMTTIACVMWIQSDDSYIREGPHIFFWTGPA